MILPLQEFKTVNHWLPVQIFSERRLSAIFSVWLFLMVADSLLQVVMSSQQEGEKQRTNGRKHGPQEQSFLKYFHL